MVTSIRSAFNADFTDAKYKALLEDIYQKYNYKPLFRIAETPLFVPDDLKLKLLDACERIIDVVVQADFKERSKGALLSGQVVPNETEHTTFLQMDFGICLDENGELTPQLIEAQGFPSLYFYQHMAADMYRKHFDIPEDYSHLFNGINSEEYIEMLRRVIVGDKNPENVILLEVEPEKQVTAIDFKICSDLLGIPYMCVSDLKCVDKDVFYERDGKMIQVERIFNRVIFDELIKRDDLKREFYFTTKEYNVEWIGHPNWFFRISKHTLPLLSDNPYVPSSYFLSDLEEYPKDLHNYVLKPLYSFSGTGVIIKLNRYDLESIKDPENYILQKKVEYAPIIATPDGPAKCEIRMLTIWEDGQARPYMVNNLARLSKGDMVGVRYNKDKNWVGGSVAYFKK